MTKTLFIPKQQKVNKHTRAGKYGKIISCPHCSHQAPVYHFAWSALGCTDCGEMVDKNDWLLVV